jgi:hypothetical protein
MDLDYRKEYSSFVLLFQSEVNGHRRTSKEKFLSPLVAILFLLRRSSPLMALQRGGFVPTPSSPFAFGLTKGKTGREETEQPATKGLLRRRKRKRISLTYPFEQTLPK